jgi:hypothetical protein
MTPRIFHGVPKLTRVWYLKRYCHDLLVTALFVGGLRCALWDGVRQLQCTKCREWRTSMACPQLQTAASRTLGTLRRRCVWAPPLSCAAPSSPAPPRRQVRGGLQCLLPQCKIILVECCSDRAVECSAQAGSAMHARRGVLAWWALKSVHSRVMRLRYMESMRTHPETVSGASGLASCYTLLASYCPVNFTSILLRLSGVLLQASTSWWTGYV